METVKTSGIGGHWHLHKVSCKKWFVRIRIVSHLVVRLECLVLFGRSELFQCMALSCFVEYL